MWNDLAHIDEHLDSRAITFENPSGARSAGGQSHGGRKGAPSRQIEAGEKIVLADIDGPGTLRHIWMTFPPAPPETMRALWFEVFYDGAEQPSISVPCLDFFGLPHGRPAAYASAVTTAQEGRGFNAYLPMPFRNHVRIELTNSAPKATVLYYQIDYTLDAAFDAASGYLHVSFRRENPTTQRQDFEIVSGLQGPGRFLGCNVGVRVIDPGMWYGEGEVKVFLDGDSEFPTICGTGLEDYVGTAWGMGRHHAPFGGSPIDIRPPQSDDTALAAPAPSPDFVGFYRWHIMDPIIFRHDLRVTIQQIGAAFFFMGQEDAATAYAQSNPPAGAGILTAQGPLVAGGIYERVDDYCATAYVYCRTPQPVPRLDPSLALRDIARRPYEQPDPFEGLMEMLGSSDPSKP